MKKIIVIFTLFLSISTSLAQQTSNDLRTAFNTYLKAMEEKNYEKALDFYYEKYFKIMSKSEFLEKLKALDTNELLDGENKNSKIISVSKSIMYDNVEYALVESQVNVYIKFKDIVDKEVIELVKEQIEAKEKKVSYSEERKEISYYRNSLGIAIKDNGWKIIPYSEKLALFTKTIVPSEVLEKLNLQKN
ncbi:hypothetical protein H2O64_08130 [Kordia sp. YSTF-M3]|uniref:DUF4878 domain-containing protein n=1 Tax=Kordia aestuariivivens TaxID=2759037 RepID=A0ABR7Q8I8_9FLAO|nr:hypothetical protein [Kordia aestuariivivens]MBC8754639.1 hypothetical protein [Kordia aestuariivivens]